MERIIGKITGGWRNGMRWEFYDQDGKTLTSVPAADLGRYMATDGTGRFFVSEINGVPVWEQLVDRPPEAPDSVDPTPGVR